MQEQTMAFMISLIKDGFIIAVAVFVLGKIIKSSLTFIDNKYIPLIGGIFGMILGIVIPGVFPEDAGVVCAIKGLIVGWSATGAFETLKAYSQKNGD